MTRTLSDITYSEGNISSGKCTGCGQVFTASSAIGRVIHESPEWALVGEFGGHECTTTPLKPVA
jgi:hypothetical protein